MMKSCPGFLRGRLRFCFGVALRERHRAKSAGDRDAEIRAWKLFGLIPLLLFHRTKHSGTIGRDELAKRADDVSRGDWISLLTAALQAQQPQVQLREPRNEQERRGAAAMSRVKRGQVSSETRIDWSCSGTEERRDSSRVARETASSSTEPNPTASDRLPTRVSIPVGWGNFREIFAHCTVWHFARPRRVHE